MLKERLCLTGINPERALSRLAKEGIPVFSAEKTDKTNLCFSVKKGDVAKVFAIYPNAKRKGNFVYAVRRLPPTGWLKGARKLKNSVGVLVGAVLFVAVTTLADDWVLQINLDAPAVYEAQIQEVLKRHGVRQYALYEKGKEDLISASLLALDGVSYCSVEKRGSVLTVTLKTNSFATETTNEEFVAERTGILTELTVLRGSALCAVGTEIAAGTSLVEGRIYTPEGESQPARIVAYAKLQCEYACKYTDITQEQAFARAYLEACLDSAQAQLTESRIEKDGEDYVVTLSYVWTQRLGI
ncbi:MAG: sporulation protein YqfD [Clostridia bacterium]|nr:sporulation protein YqfD [Clostridia bacterium]